MDRAVIDGRIVKTPADGGPLTTVLALNGAQNAGMAWVDRDTIIASVGGALEAVPADGGTPVVLSRPDTAHGETQQWGPRVDQPSLHRVHLARLDAECRRTTSRSSTGRPAARRSLRYFGTTAIGVVDDRHLLWVMTTGNVMAAAVDANGTLGPPKLVLEDVLVRPGGAAKAAMSPNGSLIYQRGLSVSQLLLVDEHGVRSAARHRARARSVIRAGRRTARASPSRSRGPADPTSG